MMLLLTVEIDLTRECGYANQRSSTHAKQWSNSLD